MAAEVTLVATTDKWYLNVVVEGMDDSHGVLEQQFGAAAYMMQCTQSCAQSSMLAEGSVNVSRVVLCRCVVHKLGADR